MAKFQFIDETIAISKLAESAVNTPYTTSTDYIGGLMNAGPVPIPSLNKIDDMDMVGDGNEWGDVLRADYWQPNSVPVGGKLNTELAGRLLLRALGGTVTNTAVTASTSYDHTANMQPKSAGRTPKLSSLIMALGGADFLYPSMAVTSWEATFNGNDPVTFAAQLINTGLWKRLSIDYPLIVVPSPETHHFVYPFATLVTFNDGSTVNYASDGRLLSGRVGLNNNIIVRPLPGDPLYTSGTPSSGAYARDIHRGRRECFASLKVSLDEDLAEFTKLQSNAQITNLTFLFKGDVITGTDLYEVEVKAPRCKLRVVSSDSDGDDAALTLEFFLQADSVSGQPLVGRVRNNQATMQ